MDTELLEPVSTEHAIGVASRRTPNWVVNANVLWDHRRTAGARHGDRARGESC